MAIFNEILSGRYNRSLQKIFAIKGPPPVRQLGSEIMPVHQLNSGVENRIMESWNRYQASFSLVANVGNIDTVRLRVPRGSNIIAVIERLSVAFSLAGEVDLFRGLGLVQANDLGGTAALNVDSRQSASGQGASAIFSGSNVTVAGGTIVGRIQVQANVNQELIIKEDDEITLSALQRSTIATLGDDFLDVRSAVANQTMLAWIQWRERVLEESEFLTT